jgi:hypothetical protein
VQTLEVPALLSNLPDLMSHLNGMSYWMTFTLPEILVILFDGTLLLGGLALIADALRTLEFRNSSPRHGHFCESFSTRSSSQVSGKYILKGEQL